MASLKARVTHLHAKEAEWDQLSDFIPKIAEIIVYDVDETHDSPRFKIGDGETTLAQLPFFASDMFSDWENIDGGEISTYPKREEPLPNTPEEEVDE